MSADRYKASKQKSLRAQSGAIFLLFIMVLVLSGTVLVVGKISLNKQQFLRTDSTLQKLQLARDALLGYALNQAIPGTVPCPDINGDGDADISGSDCSSTKGWLPFRTLGLDDLRDASGEKIWYVIDSRYAIPSEPFNHSSASSLVNSTETLAFALLAPNTTIGTQSRSAATPSASNYLEGINSDSDPFTVAYQKDDDHNDQLLAYPVDDFWHWIEHGKVLPTAIDALAQYQSLCGTYPWTGTFGQTPFDSIVGLQQGSLPIDNAISADGSSCASSLALPAWFQTHWATIIQFQFCLTSDGQCLSITGDDIALSSAIVASGGVPLSSQIRTSLQLNDHFEGENASTSAIVELRKRNNHDASFNDTVRYLP